MDGKRRLQASMAKTTDEHQNHLIVNVTNGIEVLSEGRQACLIQMVGCSDELDKSSEVVGQDATFIGEGGQFFDRRLDGNSAPLCSYHPPLDGKSLR